MKYEIKPHFIQTELYRRRNGYEFLVEVDTQTFSGYSHTEWGAYRKMKRALRRHNKLAKVYRNN